VGLLSQNVQLNTTVVQCTLVPRGTPPKLQKSLHLLTKQKKTDEL